jgi:hypothetical protein
MATVRYDILPRIFLIDDRRVPAKGAVRSMRVFVKSLMRCKPALFSPLWACLYPLIYRRDGKYFGSEYPDSQQAFQTIFEENRWGSHESRSGRGSTLEYTNLLRPALERHLEKLRVGVSLDAPCGDFNWMKCVTLPHGTQYIGGDIIASLVNNLQKKYGSERYAFRAMDIVEGPLPNAHLWLCRDVLFHLPNQAILRVFRNFVAATIPYILTTTYNFPKKNDDIKAGGFRFINLRLRPLCFPDLYRLCQISSRRSPLDISAMIARTGCPGPQ